MSDLPPLTALPELIATTDYGNRNICIAILDGPVDLEHPCFEGANIKRLTSLVNEEARADGSMSAHGTHVSSIIFGKAGGGVTGIAPR